MRSIGKGTVDCLKALFIGIAVGSAIGVIFALIGLMAYKGNFVNALNVSRSGLLLIGALCMIFSAGMFLKRGALRPLQDKDGWKRQFKILNPGYVMVFFSVGVVLIGSIVDLIIFNMR